uniref:115 kDa protein in type-1 retrotransposable element R1DM n=1 Tax=Bombyx mori TaxID=7091 RepID=A0A8R2M8X5_BOMMO|nr:uncharacterized protein LOC119631031 [Bombyx mori]
MTFNRIKWHILPKLSKRQYGFMPQRCTEDALYDLVSHIRKKLKEKKLITMVSLDIEGAFDSAWWPAIRLRLAEENCPINLRKVLDSYLEDRRVGVRYAGQEYKKKTEIGCVQGSIGGPLLWNLLLDPLLKKLENEGVYCQAFADDVVLVFDGETGLGIERTANRVLSSVEKWGKNNKLKFAPHKTKAMLITKKLKFDAPKLNMGGTTIQMSDEIKILGLIIDKKLTFNNHVKTATNKAIQIYKQVARAARVSWGLHPDVIRVIYTAVVEPIILYAASAWAPAAERVSVRKSLGVVQRGFVQKLCRAYRTVSLNAGLLLTGLLPLDLRVKEAATLYMARKGYPTAIIGDWEIERMEPVTVMEHPAERLIIKYENLENDEQTKIAIDKCNVQFYTDGSKIDGFVGAAYTKWIEGKEQKHKKLKLMSCCTVFQAELFAINSATEEILRCSEDSFGIFSDSRSSLDILKNVNSTHPLVTKITKNINNIKLQKKQITLHWIKAHNGLEGNERADQLAKEAAKKKAKPEYDKCPIAFVKRRIREESIDEWSERYEAGTTAGTTKLFFPNAAAAKKIIDTIKPTGVMTQILTGHGGFSEYLARFRCKESPACPCDGGTPETIPHILTECPISGPERFNIEQLIGVTIKTENFQKLISQKETQEQFLEYCIKLK